MQNTEKNIIVFDVETKKTFDEVGGRDHFDKLGISYVGVYSYAQQKMFGFFEKDLPVLEKILLAERPLLIGFNSLHFDVPVMQPYFSKLNLSLLPHLDILKEIEKTLGHRLKLDSVAQATIFSGKSGDGLDAIRWYREGDLESLAKYCLEDVRITRDVYEFGLRQGKLYYHSGGEKVPIDISWAKQPTILAQLQEAFKKHQQLDIEYFEVDENNHAEIVPRRIEILNMENERSFEAYCYKKNNKTKFLVSKVWKIEETGNTFAHQESLF
ncbi:MAG: hypothetical protein A2233_01155 [Candidatus Kerfeldbacteria bacterium RIFOXYA2_FULL_38_24]|uniref:YprB ribonuclease H-like domain-containing protein n=1 Tax=Candidatus Kerfeldbacteria bacterium RIFOXYB2_FULL_38_14 TaxID=1798547 RepID=A0A1G2BBY1_9BACT|nr:MAG: hypothetical protein A2233_01155 [Candidatus Kerfeldbacteria bacterium RIFOXYA2_FULL_38_24]OGY86545.1 MAG: hypothetical protein A2319_02145 [Candidatus Kerfeldbacteria bacterium RIFOXYB2_FULL_38_14]